MQPTTFFCFLISRIPFAGGAAGEEATELSASRWTRQEPASLSDSAPLFCKVR